MGEGAQEGEAIKAQGQGKEVNGGNMAELACRNDKLIISQGSVCPLCGASNLTSKWSGHVVVLNVERSEIARKLGIKVNGTYALTIND